ncbi:MAG: PDZ domain-containing protein [Acidobacteriota bacterium]
MTKTLRPFLNSLPVVLAAATALSLPHPLRAQQHFAGGSFPGPAEQRVSVPGQEPAMLSPSQGYLGVGTHDVDTERAQQLRLKEARGVEVTTIDHDAPAAKAGLRIHDVILGMNGQVIVGQAQLTRMLHDTPAGHTITLLISRDGQQQTLTLQLADRSTIEADAWSQHIPVPDPGSDVAFPAGTGNSFGNGIFSSLTSNPFYTGLDLDMLGPQLANYFGVHDGQGLLVKRVDDNSPAAAAGLRAGDVITKVNGERVATTNQWARDIHTNRGKSIQLTVIRDKHEGTLSMIAGRPKKG